MTCHLTSHKAAPSILPSRSPTSPAHLKNLSLRERLSMAGVLYLSQRRTGTIPSMPILPHVADELLHELHTMGYGTGQRLIVLSRWAVAAVLPSGAKATEVVRF